MRPGRVFGWTLITVVCLFGLGVPAHAADIDTYAKAYDRLLAQDARAADAVVTGDPEVRQGTVSLTAGGTTVTLGQGPGWVFGLALPTDTGRTLLRAALVRQDGETIFRAVSALPEGLSAVTAGEQAAQAPVASQEAALAALTDRLLGHSLQGRRVYVANAPVETAVSIPLWRDTVSLSGGPGWLFFIDDKPRANWEHPCRFALVAKTGAITTLAATTPPRDMTAFTELTSPATSENVLSAAPAVTAATAVATTTAGTDAAHRYAVIISGGANRWNNHVRYWNDCSYFFKTLKANGFLQDHIYVLISDGRDSAVDQSDGTSSNWDLNADGVDDIGYSATRANISAVFNELAGRLGSEDILYIFTTDHGGAASNNPFPYAGSDVVLWLWNFESMTNAEFAAEVNKVTAKAVVGIFEQCFSGGFVDALKAPNRVLMSASRPWELSYAMGPTYTYDEFSYYVTTALASPATGDTNGDGVVTMEEAWLSALARDSYQSETLSGQDNDGEHPSYISEPWDLGRKLALTGLHATAAAPTHGGYAQYETGDAFPPGGTAMGWKGLDTAWDLDLPFAFPLGGTTYTRVSVSSHGLLSFGGASVTSGLNSVDGLKAMAAVAPLWDRLSTTITGDDIFVTSGAGSVTVAWKAHTWIDNRPINVAVRLYPSGAMRFYYGSGNANTTLTEYRDKTIGISLANAAGGAYLFALRNGQGNLGNAQTLAIQPASLTPPASGLPWLSLLLTP